MKKRTAASTILISLVAAGCGHGDGEYVEYQNTAPSEPEKISARPRNL